MIHFEYAPWGMYFAALMYVLGNAAWVNYAVRKRRWLGWLLWSLLAVSVLWLAAMLDMRMQGIDEGVIEHLRAPDPENHWIALTLFALLSVPGAACVLLRQSVGWTRLALMLPALLLFSTMGAQLEDPQRSYLWLSLGITLAVCAALWLWQQLLDAEPEPRQRKQGV